MAARRRFYCTDVPEAAAGAFAAPSDSSGDSVSGVPDESGVSDAFSSVGATSDGGVSCCWIGFCGSGGTVGR